MNINPSLTIETVRRIINGFFALLPKILIAVIIFLVFFFVSRGINRLIRRVLDRKPQR